MGSGGGGGNGLYKWSRSHDQDDRQDSHSKNLKIIFSRAKCPILKLTMRHLSFVKKVTLD